MLVICNISRRNVESVTLENVAARSGYTHTDTVEERGRE